MRSALYVGKVHHVRFRPRPHRLGYRVFWLYAELDELEDLAKRFRFFSVNRFNLLAFYPQDHGDRHSPDLRGYVEGQLGAAGLAAGKWRIGLLTMPRILGHVFNPISVFFCHDEADRLRAVLYEVSNTFGERHSYLIPVEEGACAPFRQHCEKAFYVSPFIDMAMRYAFTVTPPAGRTSLLIEVGDDGGPLLKASLAGERVELSDRALLASFIGHPLLTLKVVAGIHWEALFIWLKRIGLRRRPPPPVHGVTVVSGRQNTAGLPIAPQDLA